MIFRVANPNGVLQSNVFPHDKDRWFDIRILSNPVRVFADMEFSGVTQDARQRRDPGLWNVTPSA